MKKLLLLGGGHAHVHVLRAIEREPFAAAEVTLVSPFERQMYSGMVPGVVAGHYRAEQAAIPLAPLADAARVQRIEGCAVALDAAARVVRLADGRELHYDVLSLDVGAGQDRDRIPGAHEHGLFVRPIEHFLQLLERLHEHAARRVLDVVVVGGGAAGVELVLALARRLGRPDDERARLSLVTGGPPPLAGYPPTVIALGLAALARHRVAVFRDSCAEIEPGRLRLGHGAHVACDVPIIATGADAPPWLAASGLALDPRGFVATGPTLQSRSHPEVFAAGDVASREDAPHPKSGVHAVRAGPPLAHNLRAFVAGGPLRVHRPPTRTLNLISCGDRRAIAAWGDWCAEGRLMWWWKDRIDRGFIARYRVAQGGTNAGAAPVSRSEVLGAGPARAQPEILADERDVDEAQRQRIG